jgi:hypothetical protein
MRFVADIYLGLYAVLALANLICCLKGGENKPGPGSSRMKASPAS